ncbi:MAG: acetyl/propionyl/methylcrotonyl-CoA carboxylase subunit alpha [Hyphomicrobiales bacterium]|uniref:acetyl/propionyl/methylcrotonyl-CoA carboxylase subunit alpha n=1 Tax=Nisaea sp. TaxID=2024842 RepID=UPI0032810926
MFKKILIANRGEIACRVMRTAKQMGIATVAVYSDADRNALHVKMADEAVYVGPPPASESYLLADKIIEACKATGAQAVHPGYGFLSENASFAAALDRVGITFIGPNRVAIEEMGDKIRSKQVAAAAGVSTVPGAPDTIENAEEAARISAEIGFPVMIKASAGGGGKGMRIAWDHDEALEGFERARSEAASSFGDDRIFIEKFIENPRHIEIQVLGDKHGNVIHLNERECSIQRRNQKVIEEAPSPFLDPETRAKMGEQACALARAVGYDSAGTVEFVAGQDKSFYFLEMNTRLQVEHPVTELITGVDLVEQMIRVAAGEKLSLKQSDIGIDGWATESRIYAEDPYRNFLPSIGRLVRFQAPAEKSDDQSTIRVDTGVVEGGDISMFYDPMIAKLCTHAATREGANAAMATALDEFVLDGIGHNVPFLAALIDHPRWQNRQLSTGFIAEEYPDGFEGASLSDEAAKKLALAALALELSRKDRLDHMTGRLRAHSGIVKKNWAISIGENSINVEVKALDANSSDNLIAVFEGEDVEQKVSWEWQPGEPLWRGQINGEALSVQPKKTPGGMLLSWRGITADVRVLPSELSALNALMPIKIAPDTSNLLLCPMPGLVVSVSVEVGQEVKAGQTLAVVEAMKMENVLRAERDATVSAINAVAGDSLAVDAVIMEFEG